MRRVSGAPFQALRMITRTSLAFTFLYELDVAQEQRWNLRTRDQVREDSLTPDNAAKVD